MSDAKVIMERLNNFNWASWKFRMELLLVKEGLWSVVSEAKPENAAATWTAKDASARATIGLALEDNQLSHVIGAETANEMWSKLKGYHERGSLCNKIHVLRKLCSLRLTEGGDMSKHLTEMAGLVHKLLGMGEKLGEHWVVAIMLSSLPESYNPLITTLEGRPEKDLNLEYVKGKLLDEWRRRCERNADCDDRDDTALRVAVRRQEGRIEGANVNREWFHPLVECFYCHEEGHFRRDCPKLAAVRRAQDARRRREEGESSNSGSGSRGNGGNHVCFTTATEAPYSSDAWLIDSGSTKHMTGKIGYLENVVSCEEEVVLAVTSTGTGIFSGCGRHGERIDVELKDMFYVPGLKANVISVSRMVDKGYTVSFGSGGCKIWKGDRLILVGEQRGALFYASQPQM